ncbi:MAG: hypothetical protein CBE00_03215 [Planctomycetaceae bacterium TMED240]|nr:hypothetical protein [Rhodopirellula sp.]OUX07902.1 MAG: hypothetical protein CBE00_03215 [Planctomycetaceae bacterium TMED240]
MLRVFFCLVFFPLLFCITTTQSRAEDAAKPDSDGMKVIFNGKDLKGWDGDPRLWSVRDGVIHGETTDKKSAKGNTFLIWEGGQLKDFELQLSFRCTANNNSGIQYRSVRVPQGNRVGNKWVVKGYQHEIRNEDTFPNVPGFIYDERGKRGRICLVGETATWTAEGKNVEEERLIDAAGFKDLMKVDDWNDVKIIAKGNRIQHFLNGKKILDFTDEHPEMAFSEGILALQLHAGKPMWTEFKDIRIRLDDEK